MERSSKHDSGNKIQSSQADQAVSLVMPEMRTFRGTEPVNQLVNSAHQTLKEPATTQRDLQQHHDHQDKTFPSRRAN